MRRPASFDPATNPVVRVTISQIRRRLESFFRSEGAHLNYRLEIIRGRYEVRVKRSTSRASAGDGPLQTFWNGFRGDAASTLIVYTEPLFFTDRQGCYVRHWQVNRAPGGLRDLTTRAPALAGLALEPTYHYLSAGEVRCLLSLSRYLAELRVPADFRNLRHLAEGELPHNHVILLGSPRTNPLLDQLQQGLPMQVTATSVALPGPRSLCDQRLAGPSKDLLRCWAVLTRFRNPTTGSIILLIGANHGAAIEGAGQALTVESGMAALLAATEAQFGRAEEGFQALLEVRVDEWQGSITQVRVAETAVLQGLGKGSGARRVAV